MPGGTICSIRDFDLWVGLLLLTDLCVGSFAMPTFFEALGGPTLDSAYALTETLDGGLAVVGNTDSFGSGNTDAFLAKFDVNGTMIFARTLGGAANDHVYAITETVDGGLAIAGRTESFGAGGADVFLAKFGANGTLIYARTLGGPNDDIANALIETRDGCLVIAGYTNVGVSDAILAKFDSNGALLFVRTLGGPLGYLGNALIETVDGGLVMAGTTGSFGASGNDAFIATFDANGTLLFVRTLGGPSNDFAYALTGTADGGLAMVGNTWSFGAGNADAYVAKFDVNGNLLYVRTLGGPNNDHARALTETMDGALVMAGYTDSFGTGTFDAFLAKFDDNGTLLFARTLGGLDSDTAYALIESMDGGLVMAGYTRSFHVSVFDAFLAKWSSEGMLNDCSYVGNFSAEAQGVNATVTSISPISPAFSPSVSSIAPDVTNINPQMVAMCPPPSPAPTIAPTSPFFVPSPSTNPVPPPFTPTTTTTTTTATADASLVVVIASAASLVVCALAVVSGLALLRYRARRRQHKTSRRLSVRAVSPVVPSSVRNSRRSSMQLRASGAGHYRNISQVLKARPQEQQYATAPAIDSPYALAPTMDSFAE